MYSQPNIDFNEINIKRQRFAIASHRWDALPIKEREQHLKDLGYNKVYAHRTLAHQYDNIRQDLIDCMNIFKISKVTN